MPLNKERYDHKPLLLWTNAIVQVYFTYWGNFIADEKFKKSRKEITSKNTATKKKTWVQLGSLLFPVELLQQACEAWQSGCCRVVWDQCPSRAAADVL